MSNVKPIVTVPSGTLSAKEIDEIKQGGYIVIVTDTPEKVNIITPECTTNGDDLFYAALDGLQATVYDKPREVFVKRLFYLLTKNRQK